MVSLSFLHSLLAFARSSGQASGRALSLLLPPSATVDALERPSSPSTGANGKTQNRRICRGLRLMILPRPPASRMASRRVRNCVIPQIRWSARILTLACIFRSNKVCRT